MADPTPPAPSPAKIGRYEIRSEIGRGGMATVYRGYDPRFKREVAVKVLPREFLHDPSFRVRFEREAQVIAALEHTAIVPVYDFGEESSQPYIVMRLMTGGSLMDRIQHGPLPLPEVARIFNRLAPALDKAHQQGIIHRDLKPGNILFDADDNPHLSDFGIAKITQSTAFTATGGIVGTPAYMSPEQGRGEKSIDGRSDIYALGAILYEMLTGQLPYDANTPMGLVVKHITEPPPRILDTKPDLPPACDGLIQKAMAKDRDKRFSTANGLAAAVAEVATNVPPPPLARAPGPVAVSQPPAEPPSVAPAGAAAAGPAAAVGGEMKACPACGKEIRAEAKVCRYCKARFEVSVQGYCANCRAPVAVDDNDRCRQCGGAIVDRHVQSKLMWKPEAPPAAAAQPAPDDKDTKQCPACGQTIRAEAKVCRYCRAKFEVTVKGYCANCRVVREADENQQCRRCGGVLTEVQIESRLLKAPPASKPAPRTAKGGSESHADTPTGPMCPKCKGRLAETKGSPVSPYINTYLCPKCKWVGLKCGSTGCDGYLRTEEMGYPNTVRYTCVKCNWTGTGTRFP